MPVNGPYLIALTVAAIALLLVLILAVKLHAFLGLMLASMALGLAAGMGPQKTLKSMQAGFGDALGFIAVVVASGTLYVPGPYIWIKDSPFCTTQQTHNSGNVQHSF